MGLSPRDDLKRQIRVAVHFFSASNLSLMFSENKRVASQMVKYEKQGGFRCGQSRDKAGGRGSLVSAKGNFSPVLGFGDRRPVCIRMRSL